MVLGSTGGLTSLDAPKNLSIFTKPLTGFVAAFLADDPKGGHDGVWWPRWLRPDSPRTRSPPRGVKPEVCLVRGGRGPHGLFRCRGGVARKRSGGLVGTHTDVENIQSRPEGANIHLD